MTATWEAGGELASIGDVPAPCSDLCVCLPVGALLAPGPVVSPAPPGGRFHTAGAAFGHCGGQIEGLQRCPGTKPWIPRPLPRYRGVRLQTSWPRVTCRWTQCNHKGP